MVAFDAGASLPDRFRAHAGRQEHLYGHLLRAMADDFDAGGPVHEICRGYQDARPGSVIQLRLLAGLFRIVLTDRAPELVPYYACLGGTEPPDRAWPVVRPVLAAHLDELHGALAIPPQTNEVGRAAALLVGLFDLVAATGVTRIRLLELGASAGLNLLLPWFWFAGGQDAPHGSDDDTRTADSWTWGPRSSPVHLAGAIDGLASAGLRPHPIELVLARGCDPDPVDPTSRAGRSLLTSFVWPFDLERHARLVGALEVAVAHPPTVERGTAAEWLGRTLPDLAPDPRTLDVVWHSISQLYWPPGEADAVQTILEARVAGEEAGVRVARVAMEYLTPGDQIRRPDLVTTLWTQGAPVRVRHLGTAHDHGIPVQLTPR
ncbi:MAG: DUF2332 domain-containing protein [Propionibacteriaceae bacterium]